MSHDELCAREMADTAVSALDKDTRLRLAMLLGASRERLNEIFLGDEMEIQTYRDPRLQPMDEPEETPAECFECCVHNMACRRQLMRCGLWYEADEEIVGWADRIAESLGCGEDCEEAE